VYLCSVFEILTDRVAKLQGKFFKPIKNLELSALAGQAEVEAAADELCMA
jgi:hypothetical protein